MKANPFFTKQRVLRISSILLSFMDMFVFYKDILYTHYLATETYGPLYK